MKLIKLLLPVMLIACAKPAATQTPGPGAQDTVKKAVVAPGLGTLKQDEFTLGLRSGALLIKVTPLNEHVIRLAAPDTYTRLHALSSNRMAEAAARANVKHPELFLVSFFSYQPDVELQPEDLQLDYQGRQLRAAAIIPLTTSWGKPTMGQQETQAAIYVFANAIDYELPLVLKYGMEQNNDWQKLIPRLQVERNKILSREKR